MTTLLLSIVLLGAQAEHVTWPPATGNNGFDQYIEAAKLVSTPEWKAIASDRPHTPFSQELPIAYLEREEKASAGILDLLKKGNSIAAYDPFKVETLATLHPEWAYFKRLATIACDLADFDARQGHQYAATDWLLTAETFAYRMPTPGLIAVLVQTAMYARLFDKALRLLPSFPPELIDRQVALAREIAGHPVDMARVSQEDMDSFDRSVKESVAHPESLGLKDEQIADPIAFMSQLARYKDLDPKDGALLSRLFQSLPSHPDASPEDVNAALSKFGASVAPADRAAYERVLPMVKAAYLPKKVSTYEIARELDEAGRAHVVALVRSMLDGPLKDQVAAFKRPEKEWGGPWKPVPDNGAATAMAMKDGRSMQWMQADFYGMHIAQVLQSLGGDDDVERLRKSTMLYRERARLFAIHAELISYAARHGAAPASLAVIGNPVDPLSGKPYAYRRTGAKTYTLAAVGVAGFPRIDMSTRAPVAK